jgi:hypothetical protein
VLALTNDAGGIDSPGELVDPFGASAQDRVGMVGAVAVDVIDGFVDRRDDLDPDDEVHVLGIPILRSRGFGAFV